MLVSSGTAVIGGIQENVGVVLGIVVLGVAGLVLGVVDDELGLILNSSIAKITDDYYNQ